MKNLLVAAIGIFSFLILLTVLLSPKRDALGSSTLHTVNWVNPDGSLGVATERGSTGHRGEERHWVNPDGTHGTAGKTQSGPLLAENSFWINPDGVKGMFGADTHDHESPVATAVAASK